MTEENEVSLENLPKPWTRRQYMFAMGIIGGKNATEAAQEAGYSKKTAYSQGPRMLKDVEFKHIQDFINSRQKKVVDKYTYDHERHIKSTVRQAQANILDFFKVDDATGNLKIDWRDVPHELGELISSVKIKQLSIKQVEGGEEISLPVLDTEFKLWDKNAARDQLNRIMSSYKDKVGFDQDSPLKVELIDNVPRK
jgi:phage terminase small subunit